MRSSHLLLGLITLTAALFSFLAVLPLNASAYLPDSRIYEQVTPPNKNGNTLALGLESGMGLAERNGNGVLFEATGAMGTSGNGILGPFAARRTPGVGWSTEAAESQQAGEQVEFFGGALFDMPDEAFNKFVFFGLGGSEGYSPEQPEGPEGSVNLYLEEHGPLVPPIWLGKPTAEHVIPEPGFVSDPHSAVPAGGTPNFENIYFSYDGTLVPEDASRAPYVESLNSGGSRENLPWGFYEWSTKHGLVSAGELPDGQINPFGAIQAAFAGYSAFSRIGDFQAGTNDNEVSEDGTKAFFVSPDPSVPSLSKEPAELYVRELLPDGEHKSVLVSRSELSGEEGKPSPDGVTSFPNPAGSDGTGRSSEPTDVYGAPDGSHAIFASKDVLTSTVPASSELEVFLGYGYVGGNFKLSVTANSATQKTGPIAWEASPAQVQAALEGLSNVGSGNVKVVARPYGLPHQYITVFPHLQASMEVDASELVGTGSQYVQSIAPPYMYEFDVETEELAYLPEVTAPILTTSRDGSRIMFQKAETSPETYPEGAPQELQIWTSGSNGGTVETVAQLPLLSGYEPPYYGQLLLHPAAASTDGSVFVFDTTSPLPGFKNTAANGNTIEEIYRYDVPSKELTCVSCPPPGVDPSGSAEMTRNDSGGYNDAPATNRDSRGMSANGSRVFFDTPDPLVTQDTNGKRDVYEWENGNVFLISSGTSTKNSDYIDSSESGDDVFFGTDSGLVPADNDRQEDVYDARIPRPSDNPPPSAVPCTGDVCQGPPSVPQLLTPAASAVFNGLGNIPPEANAEQTKAITPPKTTTCKKGFVKKSGKCVKRKGKKKKKTAKKSKKVKKSNRRGN